LASATRGRRCTTVSCPRRMTLIGIGTATPHVHGAHIAGQYVRTGGRPILAAPRSSVEQMQERTRLTLTFQARIKLGIVGRPRRPRPPTPMRLDAIFAGLRTRADDTARGTGSTQVIEIPPDRVCSPRHGSKMMVACNRARRTGGVKAAMVQSRLVALMSQIRHPPLEGAVPWSFPGKDPDARATSSLVGEAVGEGGEGEGGDEPAEADQHLLPVAGDAVPAEGDPSYRFDQRGVGDGIGDDLG
jgi:hypothetical protein